MKVLGLIDIIYCDGLGVMHCMLLWYTIYSQRFVRYRSIELYALCSLVKCPLYSKLNVVFICELCFSGYHSLRMRHGYDWLYI